MNVSATSEILLGRALPFLVLTGALIGTFLVYGPSREYSFFLDDAFDLTRLENQSIPEILFQPASDYGYYRPITFLIFNANYEITGDHNTSVLRTITLVLHALASWLLYLLVRRLSGSNWAVAAAALFLLFPFSYQTLMIIGAMGHVLVTVFTLAALLCWTEGRYRASLPLKVGAVVSAGAAAWSMEYGVIALPLLVALELYLRRRMDVPEQSNAQTLGLAGALFIAQGLYLLIWFGVDRADTASSGMEDIARNGAVWLQAAAYPGTRFLNLLVAGDEPLGYRNVVVISIVLLAAGLVVHAWLKQIRLALVVLGIAFLCFLPAMLMLTHEYVVDSPRLLYVSAPAIVAFWALLGRGLFHDRRLMIGWQVAITLAVMITLIHSHSMIERRIEMFRTSDSVVSAVVEIGNEQDDTPALVMNTPSWFSFHSMTDQEYPLGHLGVQAIPPYVGLDGLYYAATGETATLESAALAPDVAGWDYAFGPHGPYVDHDQINEHLRMGYRLYVIAIANDAASVHAPGTLRPASEEIAEHLAIFADRIALVDVDWRVTDSTIETSTTWHVREPLDGDYQISIETRDAAGNTIVEQRDYALDGMSPPRLWMADDLVSDKRLIRFEPGTPVDDIVISLINTSDGSRLETTEALIDTENNSRVIVRRPTE